MFENNFLVAINLNQNELRNAVIHKLDSPPNNPFEGQIYYNTTDHILYYYKNGKWVKNTEYAIKLLAETGTNIVSLYEGFDEINREFKFRLLKGSDYIVLSETGSYVTLEFNKTKLEETYGLSKIIQSTPFESIPEEGITVIAKNNNAVVHPFSKTSAIYDYTRGKWLSEIIDAHEDKLSKVKNIFSMTEDEFNQRQGHLEDGVYLIWEGDEPGPGPGPTPSQASYDPETKMITLPGSFDPNTKMVSLSAIFDVSTKLITI